MNGPVDTPRAPVMEIARVANFTEPTNNTSGDRCRRQLRCLFVGQDVVGVDDTWYPTQDTQTDVDEEITAASGAHEDTHEGEEEGDYDFAAADFSGHDGG
ncbi:uncharacterized protein BO87DRAFT_379887 [Aspergillus neoniger CBS 115656]|uniref:Uncharacterized protein n=1 Tax=Aspergillus neoniger (strain CBS 115656) TaxID=1448310 RepID=A0A318YCQ2_ASPNB|nr:hypothetical protein BO87DRAFT_379887 [Aspergillus neoniger CBS 115656]PYH30450.1 hypothetical protein BO87DRAFT_379887 [Aspergillus neoniger CBS 115656]